MECLLDAELMKTCKENDLKISRSSPEWPLDDTGLNENASYLVREKYLSESVCENDNTYP